MSPRVIIDERNFMGNKIKEWAPCSCLVPYMNHEDKHHIGSRVFSDLRGNLSVGTCSLCRGKGFLTLKEIQNIPGNIKTVKEFVDLYKTEIKQMKKHGKLEKLYKYYPVLQKIY